MLTRPDYCAGFLCIQKMELKVIRGGKAKDNKIQYRFIEGYVTDTRLMGVLGLHLHYEKEVENFGLYNVHCFLYYDIEEIGFDSVKVLEIEEPEAVARAEKSSFGALGAEMLPISEKESLYLVNEFIQGTKEKHKPLPLEISDIQFIINQIQECSEILNPGEINSLNLRICTKVHTDYGLVNYYIMRCIGKDYQGARLLCDDKIEDKNFDDLSFKHLGTFLQNSIETFIDEQGSASYLCQSLIDTDNSYKLLQSELKTKDGKVVSAKKRFVMPISIQEASLMLSSPEFVTVFEIYPGIEAEEFEKDFADYSIGFTKTYHDSGIMYMEFNDNNLHVEKSEFNLSDDVMAVYFVTDYGQLVVGAYSLQTIESIEKKLALDPVSDDMMISGKYQFTQSVVYEFALSGLPDFEEFIKMNE